MGNRYMPLRQRLLSRLVIDPSGCLLWTGTLGSEGYGQIGVNGRIREIHRVMWEMFAGPVPPGLVLDHLCRVRHCGNVAHLEPVTTRENVLRGVSLQAVNSTKTRCDSGHEFDLPNTYVRPDRNTRECRACNRDAARRYALRKKARQP